MEGGGRLVAYRTHDDILERWRERLSANVGMFALMVAVLVVLLLGYFVQVTRARDRHERFLDNQQRMDEALARGGCGLMKWEVGHATLHWSSSMYKLLGLDVPDSDGTLSVEDMQSLMHEDDERLIDLARSAAEGRVQHVVWSFRMLHQRSGEYVWLRARCRVDEDRRGDLSLSGIVVDMTAQHELEEKERAETSLRYAAEARFSDAVHSINEAFVLWDAEDRLVACNAKFREWMDVPESAARPGTPRNQVLSPQHRATRTKKLGAMTEAEREAGKPYDVRTKSGRWLQVSERRTGDGSLAVVGTDITQLRQRTDDMKSAERRLRANLENLRQSERKRQQRETELEAMTVGYRREKEAAERAVDAAEQARRAAEEANRSKSAFLASMSHELRTPLNAIIGFSEMMDQGLFGPLGASEVGAEKYGGYVDDIHRSAVHLLDLIGDILDMSKIEAGRFHLEREEIDICPMVEQTVRDIAIRAEQKGVAVQTAITKCLSVDADERALRQVLLNLLSNAVKFTPEGGTIEVSARRRAGHMRLAITDTGQGIPADDLERVLRPFEQVGDIATRPHEGSGLGLAISRALVEMHGGRLTLRSTVGEGTTVAVMLPLAATATSERPVAAEMLDLSPEAA